MNFIDTNILVYAYDIKAKDKHEVAKNLVAECWNDRSGVISTQVLQEFYVTVTRKLSHALPLAEARASVQELLAWSVYGITAFDVIEASELQEKLRLSFWDSLIVTAAQKSGVSVLYSEDMQHCQQIGKMTIINPFL